MSATRACDTPLAFQVVANVTFKQSGHARFRKKWVMGEDVGRKGYSTIPLDIYGGQDCPDTTGIVNLGKKSNLFCFAT